MNVPPSAPIVSSTGSSGSSSPRYASISVPPLMPENDVRTRTSPSSTGRDGSVLTATDRGPSNQSSTQSSASQFAHGVAAGSPAGVMMTAEAVRVPLPTPYGVFEVHAFERPSGHVYVAMVLGEIGDGEDVLVRLHSECLTG